MSFVADNAQDGHRHRSHDKHRNKPHRKSGNGLPSETSSVSTISASSAHRRRVRRMSARLCCCHTSCPCMDSLNRQVPGQTANHNCCYSYSQSNFPAMANSCYPTITGSPSCPIHGPFLSCNTHAPMHRNMPNMQAPLHMPTMQMPMQMPTVQAAGHMPMQSPPVMQMPVQVQAVLPPSQPRLVRVDTYLTWARR